MSRLDREKKLMVVFPTTTDAMHMQQASVVVGNTTTDAMHMQQAATKYKLPGRMIPLPGGLEAGCGLAWCTLPEQKNMLEALTEELGINTQGFFEKEW